jgi:hypothetical protein
MNYRSTGIMGFKWNSSGLCRRVMLRYDTDVSEDLAASFCNTTQRYNPEDFDLHLHRRETQNRIRSTRMIMNDSGRMSLPVSRHYSRFVWPSDTAQLAHLLGAAAVMSYRQSASVPVSDQSPT